MLPDAYIRALARLQDKVKPFPYEQVEEIVAAELGVRISKAFSRFDIPGKSRLHEKFVKIWKN